MKATLARYISVLADAPPRLGQVDMSSSDPNQSILLRACVVIVSILIR
jgi:hypothetical protein